MTSVFFSQNLQVTVYGDSAFVYKHQMSILEKV